jgi:putative ABC transport system permease protein
MDKGSSPNQATDLNPEKKSQPSSSEEQDQSKSKETKRFGFFMLLYSMLGVMLKRIRHNLGISISTLIGILAILSIVIAVPVFSKAISGAILQQQLEDKASFSGKRLFSLHMYHVNTSGLLTPDKVDKVTEFIHTRLPELLGIPIETIQTEIQSAPFDWKPVKPAWNLPKDDSWMEMKFFSLEELPKYSQIIDGEWPAPATEPTNPIQVAIIEQAAEEYYLSVGDQYTADGIDIEIAGIWRPIQENDPFWYGVPSTSYLNMMWVPKTTYIEQLAPKIELPVFYSSWYAVVDEKELNYANAAKYAQGLIRIDSELRRYLPGAATDYTPLESLNGFISRSKSLTNLIFAVSGPMVIMVLLFIGLTATISTQQYEQEIATMRGRGTSWWQVVGLNLVESGLLFILAIPFALILGWVAAEVMSRTLTFLRFTERANIAFSFNAINIGWILIAFILVTLARVFPTMGISRTTIIRVKQEQTRSTKKPLWQRFYLDFLLLIPGIYAFIVLRGFYKPTKILPRLLTNSGQPYSDPLLFVAPSLFAIALCMIALRFLPLLLRLLSKIVEKLPGIWAYLSIQQISRRPQDYANALLLIMISLGLSIFSASTAKTLDQWLYDSVYYQSGSDLSVHEFILSGGDNTSYDSSVGSSGSTISELDLNVEAYLSLEDHLKLPSVLGVTRVGKYEGNFSYGVGEDPAIFMGIDRLDFPQIAFYRDDFADQPLGALLNTLGAEPNGVLFPLDLAKEKGFQIGDRIMSSINVLDQSIERELVITGFYDYFPTVYPERQPTLIMNLDNVFDNPDSVVGYDIWMKVRPETDVKLLIYQIRQLMGSNKAVVRISGDAYYQIKISLDQPERVGIFGVLNVGFFVTGLMPAIGFILYSYASLRRRFIQLGILQAIGMSVKQLIGYLTLEQFLLMGLAILFGAIVGISTSYIFVPLLQSNVSQGVPIPPFQVLIGWGETLGLCLIFGIVLFLTILGSIFYLARIKVFQAVKMGESL